jgi:hypothetical protein
LNPQPSDFGEVSRSIYHERLDCQNQTVQTLFVGLYDGEKRRLFEQRMPEAAAPTLILPESIGELFQTHLCRLVPLSASEPKNESVRKLDRYTTDKFVPQRRPVVENQPPSNAQSMPINVPIAPIPPVSPSPLSLPTMPPVTVPPIAPPLLHFVEP